MSRLNIDLEKELLQKAKELFEDFSDNNLNDFVLSMVFLKYLSEQSDKVYEELNGLLNDIDSDYYTEDEEEIKYVLNDPDEYLARNTFKIPVMASWSYLQDHADKTEIKTVIDDAFDAIQKILKDYKLSLSNLLPRIFEQGKITSKQASDIIELLSHPGLTEIENNEDEIFGKIFEYFLTETSSTERFTTPHCIKHLMVQLIKPFKGRMFDPACGSGGFFVQTVKMIREKGGNRSDIALYGQERDAQSLRFCMMNLLVPKQSFEVLLGNSLLEDKFPELKADFILCHPDTDYCGWYPEDISKDDPRLFESSNEFINVNSTYMWLQTIWSHLSDVGTAGIVLSIDAINSTNKEDGNARKYMIENSMIDAVISLPSKLLKTSEPACIFILSKNRNGVYGNTRNRKKEILFIDCQRQGTLDSENAVILSAKEIEKILGTYNSYLSPYEDYEDVIEFCKTISLDELRKQDYNLTPTAYISIN